MKRVLDLPDWPPIGGGAYKQSDPFGVSAQEVRIKELVRLSDEHIVFTGAFHNQTLTYDFKAPNKETAKKLWMILEKFLGKQIFKVGLEIIPED